MRWLRRLPKWPVVAGTILAGTFFVYGAFILLTAPKRVVNHRVPVLTPPSVIVPGPPVTVLVPVPGPVVTVPVLVPQFFPLPTVPTPQPAPTTTVKPAPTTTSTTVAPALPPGQAKKLCALTICL
jgi:hypothetical protein